MTPIDRRRLDDAARGLALSKLDLDVVPLADLERRYEALCDAARAAQSLDDLGSKEANDAAWANACELSRRVDESYRVLFRRRTMQRLDAVLKRQREVVVAEPAPMYQVLASFRPVRRPEFPAESTVDAELPSICDPFRRQAYQGAYMRLRSGALIVHPMGHVPEWLRNERMQCMSYDGQRHARGDVTAHGTIRHDIWAALTRIK